MAKSVIYIKTDKEIKNNARKIARELGLSLSDVINASLRNFIRTREVRFSAIPHMTPELERLLGTVEQDIKERKHLSRTLATQEDVETYLDSL